MVSTDEIAFNVPGLGKNYLRAAQDRDVIAISPNGRRVCESHHWGKKLAPVVSDICTDVSIQEYIRRSRKDGEMAKEYDTICYYLIDTLLNSKPIIPVESNDDTYTGH